jgi:hypothetical protein
VDESTTGDDRVPKHLLYRVLPEDCLVFAPLNRAMLISQIRDAIEHSRTWEEFRQAMPPEEYDNVLQMRCEDESVPPPQGPEKFEADMVPGYVNGDYPPWLQQEMGTILPPAILTEYGHREFTALDGDYIHIEATHLPAILSKLRDLGYEVDDGTGLNFF